MCRFICPKCSEKLTDCGKFLSCSNNHCYDKAKSGYVNLLLKQSPSDKHHGDDKLMVEARTHFLEKGYYSRLADALCNVLREFSSKNTLILDAGCGEGYYTDIIEKNTDATVIGVDISKQAINTAAKKNKNICYAVASVFSLPIQTESIDVLLTIFSPYAAEEYQRVLKKGGRMVMVIPLENHLIELKKSVYASAYTNDVKDFELEGFMLETEKELQYDIFLDCHEDILNLFSMTPYYYKTSREDQMKLDDICQMNVSAEFAVLIYRKQ